MDISFNGIVWAGFDLAEYFEKKQSNPGYVANDNTGGNLFTGRELRSERFANDTQFAANTASGVNYVMNTQNWGAVASSQYGSVRYRNWKATSSNVKYGLAVTAWQAPTTPTVHGFWCVGDLKNALMCSVLIKLGTCLCSHCNGVCVANGRHPRPPVPRQDSPRALRRRVALARHHTNEYGFRCV